MKQLLLNPLGQPCCHPASPAELERDRDYQGCFAAIGETCRWAKRFDGFEDPAYHSERIEAAIPREPHSGQVNDEAFERAVLDSCLV